LIVEIVESEGIESFDEVFLFVEALRAYGCRIAIDDFGSGYSNFSYLSKINIDFIKIDGSLIKDIDKDENQRIVVESILHFAKAQGIKTIAEFVENKEIFDILVELGVDFSQGFFFSKPEMILCEK